jgi:hypothetical protein
MTHFEAYQWEDHVPRAGSWKFNLAVGVLALGLIAAAFPDTYGNASVVASAAAAPSEVQETKATVQPVKSWWVYCPTATTDYADS